MKEQLTAVYPFINEWLISKGAEYCGFDLDSLTWSTDYTEYILTVNNLDMPQFMAINIEMVRSMNYAFTVIDEAQFLKVVEVLG